jgi:hypothetical protein
MSNRTKTIISMAVAGSAAAAVGVVTAPVDENAIAHGALWGSSAAAATGVVSMFLFDSEHKIAGLEKENRNLQAELNAFKFDDVAGGPQTVVRVEGPQNIPFGLRNIIQPQELRLEKLGKDGSGIWVPKDQGVWVRECEIATLATSRLGSGDAGKSANHALEGDVNVNKIVEAK